MWNNEITLLECLVRDFERQFGLDLHRDVEFIKRSFATRGFTTTIRFLKQCESEMTQSMASGTEYKTRFLRSLFLVSPPSSRVVAGFLAKFDNGLTDSALVERNWLAAKENETRLGSSPRNPFIVNLLHGFADKYLPSNREPTISDLLPRHGSGAVAECLTSLDKFDCEFGFDISEFTPDFMGQSHARRSRSCARFFCVPKDATKLRSITIEPCARQYMQQALRRLLVQHIESHPLLRRHLQLRDATANGKRAGSRNCATLDLENASDSIPCWQVYALFKNWPNFRRWLFASRSSSIEHNGEVLNLVRYAGMGNATTFSIESLVFLALTLESLDLLRRDRKREYSRALRDCITGVGVYGDDIVVPNNAFAGTVLQTLVLAGYIPSKTKTCICGDFKESCGYDYYRTMYVNIPRLRSPLDRCLYIDDLRALTERLTFWGLSKTRTFLYHYLTKRPDIQMALFGKHDRDLCLLYDRGLQTMLLKTLVPSAKQLRLDGTRGLLSFFTRGSATVDSTKVVPRTRMLIADYALTGV